MTLAPVLAAVLASYAPAGASWASYAGSRVGGGEQAVDAASGPARASTARTPWASPFTYDETASDRTKQYNGRVFDPGTGFHDYGARMYWPEIGRFISADTVMGSPGRPASLNRYSYVLNNPYKYVDPTGREVSIAIKRDTYTPDSVTGTIAVTSDVPGAGSFNGYTLETAHAGKNLDKAPISPGTYDSFVRTDHTPNRIELKDVPGFENVQIHVGNWPTEVIGCFAAGKSREKDQVNDSMAAMSAILNVVKKDGTGKITTKVEGAPTPPPPPQAPAQDPHP